MQWLEKLKKATGLFESTQIREIKRALKAIKKMRSGRDEFVEVVQGYPLMCDLAKSYIEEEDWESAQDIIRVCFKMRDEYAAWSGDRTAFLVRKLAREFIKFGREDIAQHIFMKVRNFESGVPIDLLSHVFLPDREALMADLGASSPPNSEDEYKQGSTGKCQGDWQKL